MTKPMSLSERLSERAKEKKSRSHPDKTAFIALKSEIEQSISDGWKMKFIWEQLKDEGKINFSYETFRVYVNVLISNKNKHEKDGGKELIINAKDKKYEEQNTEKPVLNKQQETPKKTENHEPKIVESTIRGFVFNPVPPKDEDIY